MEVRGLAERATSPSYERDTVRAVVESLGIDIAGETDTDFLCYCPFHDNTDTPAFAVGVENGLAFCFNPVCSWNAGGKDIVLLVMARTGRNFMEAKRYIMKKGSETHKPLEVKLEALQAEERWPILPQLVIDDKVKALWEHQPALDYLRGRGFEDETIRHFEVGYAADKDMVVVPIHDADGNPIGVNGRSIEGKRFKLTRRIPRNKVLFNLHRAKQAGGTIIVCESQFDVMRIHQAGFPNAVCFLGSYVSRDQAALLKRYADRVIIMTDADEAGRKAGHTLAAMLRGTRVEWAIHDWGVIFPHGAKDAGDMTDDEIRHVINNAVSDISYKMYKPVATGDKV